MNQRVLDDRCWNLTGLSFEGQRMCNCTMLSAFASILFSRFKHPLLIFLFCESLYVDWMDFALRKYSPPNLRDISKIPRDRFRDATLWACRFQVRDRRDSGHINDWYIRMCETNSKNRRSWTIIFLHVDHLLESQHDILFSRLQRTSTNTGVWLHHLHQGKAAPNKARKKWRPKDWVTGFVVCSKIVVIGILERSQSLLFIRWWCNWYNILARMGHVGGNQPGW